MKQVKQLSISEMVAAQEFLNKELNKHYLKQIKTATEKEMIVDLITSTGILEVNEQHFYKISKLNKALELLDVDYRITNKRESSGDRNYYWIIRKK